MKKKSFTVIITYLCVFFSCSHQQQEHFELEKLYIDIKDNYPLYDISDDILPEFDFVRLETTDSCLIGRVDKISFENGKYYILSQNNHVIDIFSESGKYISTLNHLGQGPDEYVEINAFTVENNNIWIFDRTKVLCYDSKFNVIDRINLKESGFWIEDMIYENGYLYMINNWIGTQKVCYQALIYDTTSKQLLCKKAFSPLQYVQYRGMSHQIASIDSLCLISFSFCDTIFQIKNDSIIPKYQYIFSAGADDKPISYFDNNQKEPELIKGLTNIYQTSNSIILRFSQGKIPCWAIFNKNDTVNSSRKSKIYSGFTIADLGNYRFDVNLMNKYLISIFDDASAFKMYFENFLVKDIKNEQLKIKLKNEVSKIKEDDNPVLFRFTFKKESNL